MTIDRRSLLTAAAAAPVATRASTPSRFWHTIVVGAGVFGAWTASRLQAAGQRVLLIDSNGPAHARASSGGESRMTRSDYGADEIYTRMAHASLGEWQTLSRTAELPLFHRCGVLFLFQRDESYARDSIAVHRRLGLPLEQLDRAALRRRWPQIDASDITLGLHEADFGALMARRSVLTLVDRFVRAGGSYRQAQVLPPTEPYRVNLADGRVLLATRIVYAAGPWLPKLFPDLLARRIFPTRQEIVFLAPPAGDDRFGPAYLPGWADWNGGDIVYGFPDLESRGFKLAQDRHGPPIDPDSGDRLATRGSIAFAHAYAARRFPALAGAQLVETRVCQYENSANGDFLIDRHPNWPNVILVGGGSGHGFKHGPEVGRLAAALALDSAARPEPRFSLATKGETQARAVH